MANWADINNGHRTADNQPSAPGVIINEFKLVKTSEQVARVEWLEWAVGSGKSGVGGSQKGRRGNDNLSLVIIGRASHLDPLLSHMIDKRLADKFRKPRKKPRQTTLKASHE